MDFQCLARQLIYKKPSMKKRLISLLFATICISLCLVATAELLSQRGMKPIKIRTRAGQEIELYKDSYALVVGNGAYTAEGRNPLKGAVRDVEEVAAVLEKHGFKVTLKTNLTKAEFDRAFAEFVLKSGKEKNNRLLFYYAGHGYTRKSATDENLGYLVMVDAPSPHRDEVGFELESVDMESIVRQAEKIQARHALFMFDSCFSGTILNARDQLTPPESISDNIKYPVRQFITAGREGEIVPDHSDFKQAFLDLIEGRAREPFPDGYITGEELGFYLKNQVPLYNPAQHPQYGKIPNPKLDKGDFVFVVPKTPGSTDLLTMATLAVTSMPSGANIYLDNAWIGKTPLASYKVNTGGRYEKQVTVSLELSGYKYRVANLTLREGEKTPWEVRLEKLIPRMATLTVTSTPSGASVYVDGALIGPTPLRDYKIDTGLARERQVDVGLELSGYKYRAAKLMLKGGEKTPSDVRLEQIPEVQKTVVPSGTTPEGMVLIPAGEFQMGSNDGEFDEKPVHTVYVNAFYMDVYEVTNAQYKEFVDSNPQWGKDQIPSRYHDGNYLKHWTGNSYGRGDHPVVYVSWYGAMAYAEWAGKRLPTEAEWERAARGGLLGKKYPWGNLLDSSKANYRGGGTTAVGRYLPNKYGLYDVVGNVWEWCLDAYDEDFYKGSPRRNPIVGADSIVQAASRFTTVKSSRVLRGGAWSNSRSALRVADRRSLNPVRADNSSGFRCAKTVSP